MRHRINLFLIFLTPIAAVSGIIYQLIIGKEISFIIILAGILPGAIISVLKELKATLPPDKLIIEIDTNKYEINDNTRDVKEIKEEAIKRENERIASAKEAFEDLPRGSAFFRKRFSEIDYTGKMITQGDTNLSIPMRLRNRDFDRKISVLDIKVESRDKVLGIFSNNENDNLTFNNEKIKTVEPTSRADYKIRLSHPGKPQTKYCILLSFTDNYERSYKKRIIIDNS